MIPAPFEVRPDGDRFTWALLGACGRALVYSGQTYPCTFSAAAAAKEARGRLCEAARAVDGVGQ